MTAARTLVEDRALPLFDVPSPPPRPGAVEPGLALAGPASRRPFLLEGADASVRGVGSSASLDVHFPASGLSLAVGRAQGAAANVLVSPGRLRREWVGRGVTGMETVLVLPTLPLVACGWTGGEPRAPIDVVLAGASGLRYHAEGRHVTVAADGAFLAAACVGVEGTWEVHARPDGGAGLRWEQGDDGEAPLLLLAAGSADAVRTAFRAAAHMTTHEARATRTGMAGPDGLALETGVREIDEGFAWARLRVAGGARRLGDRSATPPLDALWVGLASAAVSDEEAVLRCRHLLIAHGWTAAAALLAGRIALSAGRTREALADARAWLAGGPPERTLDGTLAPAAARALADGLRHALPEAALDAVRTRGEVVGRAAASPSAAGQAAGAPSEARSAHAPPDPQATGSPSRGRALPTVGAGEAGGRAAGGGPPASRAEEGGPPGGRAVGDAAPASPEPHHATTEPGPEPHRAATEPGPEPHGDAPAAWLGPWLTRLFEGAARGPAGTGAPPLDAWAAFGRSADEGWTAWRLLLADALDGGARGWGLWDDGAAPTTAALLLLALTHGLLGVLPDAPSGRIGLAPRVPAHLTGLTVHGLPVGDARMTLRYARSGTRHRLTMLPTAGRTPPMIVLEPRIPGRVIAVSVDGRTTDVSATLDEGDSVIRLQTPLDDVRVVELVTAPGDGAGDRPGIGTG